MIQHVHFSRMITLVLLAGCIAKPNPVASTDPAKVSRETIVGRETAATQSIVVPAITPLPDDAATLKKLMGYDHAVVYEFSNMWLECWLECEVDGKIVESSSRARVAPDEFSLDEAAGRDGAGKVNGWITVWGKSTEDLNVKVRSQYHNDVDGSKNDYLGYDFTHELQIPDRPTTRSSFRFGTNLEEGWRRPVNLAKHRGGEFVIQSYHFSDHEPPDGPVVRRVKVSLKAKQLGYPDALDSGAKDK